MANRFKAKDVTKRQDDGSDQVMRHAIMADKVEIVPDVLDEAWRDRIVRALDHHDDLLAQVKRFRKTAQFYLDGGKPSRDDEGIRLQQINIMVLDQLIASAEGGANG